ncbi:MAG: tetratricopeptide repeat protein [Streptosporangiaceae bacterium]
MRKPSDQTASQIRAPGDYTTIMEFRILGPTELWLAGQPSDIGPAKERSALAILLLTPRTIVPAEQLIERLWDTRPPVKARETLSVYIARLRASLRQSAGDQVRLAGRASGYVLDVAPESVDLHQFRRLRRQAAELAADGDHEAAAKLLREADGMWRGQALAGIRGDWVARMRVSLEEERRAALVERVACELTLGRHAELVGELGGALAQYPYDETVVAQLMTALYRSGRPADALSLYRDTRARLVAEQGSEPGESLSDLHQRILNRDPQLAPPAASPAAGRRPRPENLALRPVPQLPTGLTLAGRWPGAPEPAATTGTGQSGAPYSDPDLDRSFRALTADHQRIARLLAVSPCADIGAGGAAALGGVGEHDAERALDALAAAGLAAPAAGHRYRLTSRGHGYAAARASSEETKADRRNAIGRLLGYYLRMADQADRTLHPFRHRMPVAPDVAGTTPAGTARPAVTLPVAVANGQPARLADDAARWLEEEWRNLLQAAQYASRNGWPGECAGLTHALAGFIEVKGYWHEAIAAYTQALQACRDQEDPAGIARAALELSLVSQQAGRHEDTLSLAEEAAAIYQALGDHQGLADALDQAGRMHLNAARSREALACFEEARTLYGEAADRHGMAAALGHVGIVCWHLGRHRQAIEHLRAALSLYQEAGDRRGEAKMLSNLGKVQLHSGRYRDALDSFQQSLDIFTEIGGDQNRAILYHAIGGVHLYKGSFESGLRAFRQALAIYRAIGDRPNEANVLNDIGAIFMSAERHDDALNHYERARLLAETISSAAEQVTAMRGIADARRGSGRLSQALDDYHAALALARLIGDPYEEAKVLEGIAETTLSQHKPYAARIVFRQALDIFEQLGVPEAESARIRMEMMNPAAGRRTS